MKVGVYEHLVKHGLSRRGVLKGAASVGALSMMGQITGFVTPALADDALRQQILAIPGVGKGSPTDADWQKVGELCLGPTKANVKEGEFAGVELTFLGLNNQNLHNFLFRGFLASWEKYTGAKINWIDLAQADYNPRLQQAIATGTVDFDILEMGAPFEGDTAGKGLLDEMPDWVKKQIEMDDYVAYLKAPVGTWAGKTYRVSIDGDCHTMAFRTDYFKDEKIVAATGAKSVPMHWDEMDDFSKKVKGQKDPLSGQNAYGFLDPLKGWGGFGFYFLEDRATAYVKHPDNPAWLFEPETMKPMVNNPGWVQAIQDVMDLIAADAYPKDQINADPGTTGFQQFLAGTGSAISWWGDIGQGAQTSDTSVVGNVIDFSINPGAKRVYNHKTSAWEEKENFAPNLAYLGWGIYVTKRVSGDEKKRKAAWSAAAHLGGKDLSIWTSAYPSGFQPYRSSQMNGAEYTAAGYELKYITSWLKANADSYNHPNGAIEPRIPGIFQYYSVAEDELSKGYAGKYKTAQETADAIAAAWEKITDQIGRGSQIKLYKASMGM